MAAQVPPSVDTTLFPGQLIEAVWAKIVRLDVCNKIIAKVIRKNIFIFKVLVSDKIISSLKARRAGHQTNDTKGSTS